MLMQYGSPREHRTEEARSRFFSPVRIVKFSQRPPSKVHHNPQIFNHLVNQFNFMLRNNPETMMDGRIGTQGCIEYLFQTFGVVAVLFIEMKLKVGNDVERLNSIAQVIAECDRKSQHLTLHIWVSFFDRLRTHQPPRKFCFTHPLHFI